MSKYQKYLILFSVLVLSGMRVGASEFQLSEKSLQELAQKGAPQLDQIQASFLAVDLQNAQTKEQFAPELFGGASYAETNERAIIQFIPIWSPLKQAQLGVRQNLRHGFSAEAAVGTDQRTAVAPTGKYRNITTSSLSFAMQMDLWKDLFGRMSKAKLETVHLDSKRAGIEQEIQMKAFGISLRRIYWALVANQESIKISQEILTISQKQAAETKQRFKNAVAEADEVARYEAQVASKQASLLYYQYQRENLLKQLKTLLPELSQSKILLSPYDLSVTVNEVVACTATISQEPKVPYQFTKYDEAIQLIRQVKAQTVALNSRYADPDIKLYGKVKATGVGSDSSGTSSYRGSYGSSIDDLGSTNRTGYEVGLKVTIPLGDAKAETKKTKELYDEKRLMAAIDASDTQVINTHQQLVSSISLLNEVIRAQKISTRELEKRVLLMLRKYQQARVSVNDLIQDQDALLRSNLTTVETQLQILNVLFDYLAIYTETPCSFNRI